MASRPGTPQELLDQLCEIFPGFRKEWDGLDNPYVREDGTFQHHGVMLLLHDHFAEIGSLTEAQARAFADLLNRAVTQDDDLENAVATCFLEHMRQIRMNRMLNPYLSAVAKRKSHA